MQCLEYYHSILLTPEACRLPAISLGESSAIHNRDEKFSSGEINAIAGDLATLAGSGHTAGFVR